MPTSNRAQFIMSQALVHCKYADLDESSYQALLTIQQLVYICLERAYPIGAGSHFPGDTSRKNIYLQALDGDFVMDFVARAAGNDYRQSLTDEMAEQIQLIERQAGYAPEIYHFQVNDPTDEHFSLYAASYEAVGGLADFSQLRFFQVQSSIMAVGYGDIMSGEHFVYDLTTGDLYQLIRDPDSGSRFELIAEGLAEEIEESVETEVEESVEEGEEELNVEADDEVEVEVEVEVEESSSLAFIESISDNADEDEGKSDEAEDSRLFLPPPQLATVRWKWWSYFTLKPELVIKEPDSSDPPRKRGDWWSGLIEKYGHPAEGSSTAEGQAPLSGQDLVATGWDLLTGLIGDLLSPADYISRYERRNPKEVNHTAHFGDMKYFREWGADLAVLAEEAYGQGSQNYNNNYVDKYWEDITKAAFGLEVTI